MKLFAGRYYRRGSCCYSCCWISRVYGLCANVCKRQKEAIPSTWIRIYKWTFIYIYIYIITQFDELSRSSRAPLVCMNASIYKRPELSLWNSSHYPAEKTPTSYSDAVRTRSSLHILLSLCPADKAWPHLIYSTTLMILIKIDFKTNI